MIEVLSESSNSAVVKLDGRRFPGVVIQGDSLYNLVCLIDELRNSLPAGETKDLASEISQILKPKLDVYEDALDRLGIETPYARQK